LWEVLDARYANRWILASDTIKNFFSKPHPDSNQEEVLSWLYEQFDALTSVIDLKMTVEEIGTNILIQALPDEFGREVRNGLRAAQAGKKKATFTIKELREVVNDTIAVKDNSVTKPTTKSTLTLQTSAVSGKPQTPQGNPQGYPKGGYSNTRGASNNSHKTRGGVSGRGRGFSLWRNNKTRHCKVCVGDKANGHPTHWCQHYPTPEAKCKQLKSRGLCQACACPKHPGQKCPDFLECKIHPGQKHYDWLCGGNPHPGTED